MDYIYGAISSHNEPDPAAGCEVFRQHNDLPQPPGTSCGFTLIELLVVLAILGVVLGIAYPRIGRLLPGTILKTSARRLAVTVHYLANQAILKQRPHRLYLDVESNTYWSALYRDGKESKINDNLFRRRRLPDGLYFGKIEQAEPFNEEKKITYVEFLPSGEVEQTLIIISSEDQLRTVSLKVYAYGGKTRIEEGAAGSFL